MSCFCLPVIPFPVWKLPLHVVLVGLTITWPHLPARHIIQAQPVIVLCLPTWPKGRRQESTSMGSDTGLLEKRVFLGFRLWTLRLWTWPTGVQFSWKKKSGRWVGEGSEGRKRERGKKFWDSWCNSSWSPQTPGTSQLISLSVPPFRFKPIWVGLVPHIGCVLTSEPCHWVIVWVYLGKGPKANVKLSACRSSVRRMVQVTVHSYRIRN